MHADLSLEQLAAIRSALQRGSKIEAVKLYREATGLSLAASKDAVESLGQREGIDGDQRPLLVPRDPGPPPSGLTPAARAAVIEAITGGRKIEAIKLYRDATGLGLAESKEEVEALEAAIGKTPVPSSMTGLAPGVRTPLPNWDPSAEKTRSGCFAVVAVLILGGAIVFLATSA